MIQPKRTGARPRQGSSPEKSSSTLQRKDSHFCYQKRQVLQAFSDYPKTMLQVAQITNTERANICRYVSFFLKLELIIIYRTGLCPITNHRADFYLATGKELQHE